jgi:hypothetical protein
MALAAVMLDPMAAMARTAASRLDLRNMAISCEAAVEHREQVASCRWDVTIHICPHRSLRATKKFADSAVFTGIYSRFTAGLRILTA